MNNTKIMFLIKFAFMDLTSAPTDPQAGDINFQWQGVLLAFCPFGLLAGGKVYVGLLTIVPPNKQLLTLAAANICFQHPTLLTIIMITKSIIITIIDMVINYCPSNKQLLIDTSQRHRTIFVFSIPLYDLIRSAPIHPEILQIDTKCSFSYIFIFI